MASDAEIRGRLERKLGRPVPDALWTHLVERSFVHDVRVEPGTGFDELVREARDMVALARRLALEGDTERRIRVEPRDPALRARLEALRFLHAEYASAHDIRVRTVRAEVLGGAPLAPAAVRAVLTSPLNARFSSSILDHVRIPAGGHEAVLREETPDRIVIDVSWPRHHRTLAWQPSSPEGETLLHYAATDGPPTVIPVWAGSLLDELRIAAEQIAPTYLWEPAETAAFLLEGGRPSVIGAWLELRQTFSANPSRSTIVIHAEAWLPVQVISDAYRGLQRQLLPNRYRGAFSRTARATAFVAEFRASGARFTWAAAMAAWNAAQTSDAMRWRDYRVFQRDCQRASQNLLFVPYRLAGVEYPEV